MLRRILPPSPAIQSSSWSLCRGWGCLDVSHSYPIVATSRLVSSFLVDASKGPLPMSSRLCVLLASRPSFTATPRNVALPPQPPSRLAELDKEFTATTTTDH